eukprot:582267-Rhodomonas_salina.1
MPHPPSGSHFALFFALQHRHVVCFGLILPRMRLAPPSLLFFTLTLHASFPTFAAVSSYLQNSFLVLPSESHLSASLASYPTDRP